MGRLLIKYKLTIPAQEDIENLNILYPLRKEINNLKSSDQKKKKTETQGPDGMLGEFYQTFNNNLCLKYKRIEKKQRALPKSSKRYNYQILENIGAYVCDLKKVGTIS